jgi:anti-sigma B factor antagonist
MKFSIDKQERFAVFTLNEKNLNSIIAPNLKSEFIFLSNEGIRNLIFDISGVEYADSSGLSSILTANRIWKDNGNFIIAGTQSAAVKKLIEISKLNSILTIIPTIDESIDYVMLNDLEEELQEEADQEEDSDQSEE